LGILGSSATLVRFRRAGEGRPEKQATETACAGGSVKGYHWWTDQRGPGFRRRWT
jgi:hypothetical protein